MPKQRRQSSTSISLPVPIDFKRIWLLDKNSRGDPISYTDCMESSVLRFVQACLCDLSSLKQESGRPSIVDLKLARARVKDADVLAFLEAHPHILTADAYNSGDGFQQRNAWARLVTNKPFFTYKRASTGVYKNDALTGLAATPPEGFAWRLELEPCVHNIVAVCRHFLGCDLDAADRQLARRAPMAEVDSCDSLTLRYDAWRLIGRGESAATGGEAAPPFAESFGEAHAADVSAAAQAHIDAALLQLSRPGLQLKGRLCVERPPLEVGFSHTFESCLDLHLNGEPAWRWALTRISLGPYLVPPYDVGCRRYESGGDAVFFTSAHSCIEVWDARSGEWDMPPV